MKVSKTVKEYIAKKVCEAYAEKINIIGREYLDKKKEIEEKLSEMQKEFREKATALIEENCGTWDFSSRASFGFYSIRIGDADYEQEIRNREAEIRIARDNKVEEIIVTLELGGTKADLEKMLNNIEAREEEDDD